MQKEQKIVIHLGLHKTGSTFLQKNVFPKLKEVEMQRLICICQIKFNSDKRILLISSEGLLSSMPHYDNTNIKDSIEALYHIFPNAKIILGVRNERSWFKSCWNQYIKNSGTMSFSEYLLEYGGNCMLPREYVDIIDSTWKDVFVYDQKELLQHSKFTIERMCKFIGVPVPAFDMKTVNKSFPRNKINILKFINHWTFAIIIGTYNKVYAKIISW